ncbi:MAG: Thiol-disulfide oxidoreductase ResA [Phycisphaerae bacterium]|nr:Thiol-disulfide oxidoreductase ResA [Phycisphaerae bacterium]
MTRVRILSVSAAFLIASLAMAQEKSAGAGVKVGQPAPEFALKDCCGKDVKLSDYKGKIVVLEWINRECPVSKKLLPVMKETQAKYASKGVIWLPIDSTHGHKAEDNHAYVKDNGLPYNILCDGDGAAGHTYGARTTPHMFIIGKDGKVAYAGAIDDQKSRNYVSEALESLLAGKAVEVSSTQPYGCSVKYKRE